MRRRLTRCEADGWKSSPRRGGESPWFPRWCATVPAPILACTYTLRGEEESMTSTSFPILILLVPLLFALFYRVHCPQCGHGFSPLASSHSMFFRRLLEEFHTCPKCGVDVGSNGKVRNVSAARSTIALRWGLVVVSLSIGTGIHWASLRFPPLPGKVSPPAAPLPAHPSIVPPPATLPLGAITIGAVCPDAGWREEYCPINPR